MYAPAPGVKHGRCLLSHQGARSKAAGHEPLQPLSERFQLQGNAPDDSRGRSGRPAPDDASRGDLARPFARPEANATDPVARVSGSSTDIVKPAESLLEDRLLVLRISSYGLATDVRAECRVQEAEEFICAPLRLGDRNHPAAVHAHEI